MGTVVAGTAEAAAAVPGCLTPPTSHAGRRPPCLNCLERRRPLAPHVCPGPRSAGDPDPPPSTRGPGGKPPTLRHQPIWTRTLATSSWPPAFQVSLVVGSALQQVLHPLPDVVKLGPHVPANHCPVGRTPAHTTSPPPNHHLPYPPSNGNLKHTPNLGATIWQPNIPLPPPRGKHQHTPCDAGREKCRKFTNFVTILSHAFWTLLTQIKEAHGL